MFDAQALALRVVTNTDDQPLTPASPDGQRRQWRCLWRDCPLREGDIITLDGNQEALYHGAMRVEEQLPQDLLECLDRLRRTCG